MNCSKFRRFYSLLSFLFPFVSLCLYFIWKEIAPFGNNTFLIHDMNAQYVDFYAYLRTVIQGENDFLYSLSRGLGGSFPVFFAYYLICPLNVIPLLFPDAMMPVGITLEMLFLFGFTGLSCFVCLKKHVPDVSPLILIYLSTAYSLSAWMLLNAENFQFIQEAVILPLLVISLENLKQNKKMLPAVLLLTAALVLNFYIGAMIWLFSALWLFVPDREKKNWRYIFVFIAALFLTSPIWVSTLLQMGSTIKQMDPYWYEPGFNFKLIDLLKKFLPGQFDAIQFQDAGLPAVYCGLLTLVMVLYWIFEGEYSPDKNHHLIILVIMFISLIFRPLTMIWQGFSQPHWWPYRFSFLLIFLLILCASESRLRIPLILLIPCFVGLLFNLDKTFSVKLLWAEPLNEYADAVQEKKAVIDSLKENNRELFRIGDISPRSDNDAMHFSYNGITGFDSLADRRVMEFLSALGFIQERYTVRYGLGNTVFANELLGVRYVLGKDNSLSERKSSGLAFWIGPETDMTLPDFADAVNFQNSLAKSLGMESVIIKAIDAVETELFNIECTEEFCWKPDISEDGVFRYKMQIPGDGILYAMPESPVIIGEMAFHIGDKTVSLSEKDVFLPLTSVHGSEDISIDVVVSDSLMEIPKLKFGLEDDDTVLDFFAEHIDGIFVEKIKSSQIRITFPRTMEKKLLAIMLPYDKKWHAVSNKENIITMPLWETFLAAEIPAETSEIILSYR